MPASRKILISALSAIKFYFFVFNYWDQYILCGLVNRMPVTPLTALKTVIISLEKNQIPLFLAAKSYNKCNPIQKNIYDHNTFPNLRSSLLDYILRNICFKTSLVI